jgi:hypothetical protein
MKGNMGQGAGNHSLLRKIEKWLDWYGGTGRNDPRRQPQSIVGTFITLAALAVVGFFSIWTISR